MGPVRARTGRLLLLSVVALALAGLLAGAAGRAWLRARGVEALTWQGPSLSFFGVGLDRLALTWRGADARRLEVEAEGLWLSWPGLAGADRGYLRQARVARLALTGEPPAGEAAPNGDPPPDPASLLAWLPQELRLDRWVLDLPCASGRCVERGALVLRRNGFGLPGGDPLDLRLEAHRDDHALALRLLAQRLTTGWTANLLGELDRQPLLALASQWRDDGGAPLWQGELEVPGLPDTAVLLDWLAAWTPLAGKVPRAPRALHLSGRWTLRPAAGEAPLDPARVWRGGGSAEARIDLPQPWPVPAFGLLEGHLDLALEGDAGRWRARRLDADLRAGALQGDAWEALPSTLRPRAMALRLTPLDEAATRLQLHLSGPGEAQLEVDTRLVADDQAPLAARLEDARLQASGAAYRTPAWSLGGLALDLRLEGRLDRQRADLRLRAGSSMALDRLEVPGVLGLERLGGETGELDVTLAYGAGPPPTARLQGPLSLRAGRLRQAELLDLGWRFAGDLDLSDAALAWRGRLENDAGLRLDLDGARGADGALALKARLPDLFLRAGNPLAKTARQWPALLSLSSGRLGGEARLDLPAGGAPATGALALTADGLAGIYDRVELNGLRGRLALRLDARTLTLDLPALRLDQLNPGVPLGPLALAGAYRAERARPLDGRLAWTQAESGVLGGRAWLAPGALDLGAAEQRLDLRLGGLQLAELFRVYPAEGLSGQGVIDGELPLRLDGTGPRIEAGRLAAREPGFLRFRSPKLRALAHGNPGMGLVADALDDFRYERLDSRVGYDEHGTLRLGLTLQGRNPALQGGRPINLDVNLEEDLPALLTSLQLTDRVSDTIRQRVQERLRHAPAP